MYNMYVKIIKGEYIMNKLKFLKRYTYTTILDVNFNIVIHFDYDNEMLLYSLEVEDNNYNSTDYLVECATSLNDDRVNNVIRVFMLDYVASNLNNFAKEQGYNDWSVKVYRDGFKLINNATKQYADWWLYDYDEDYELLQSKAKKFLIKQPKD